MSREPRLERAYAYAITRLRMLGEHAVADRLAHRGFDPDRTPMCIAIMAAVDAVDCRRAAEIDRPNASIWTAVADDLSRRKKVR